MMICFGTFLVVFCYFHINDFNFDQLEFTCDDQC